MIKLEQEMLEQLAKAFTDELSRTARIDLMFSALFELDKIQKGQTTELSKAQLVEVNSDVVTQIVLKQIAAVAESHLADIKTLRSILTQIIRVPGAFGLSGKMRSLFLPYTKTFIDSEGEVIDHETDLALLYLRDWMTRKVLSIQDLGTNAEDAQTFVDALRIGNYAITSKFSRWVTKKYSDVTLNPEQLCIGAEDIFPLVAYELAQTDIRAADMAAIMYMYDHTIEDNQYTASLIFSGIQTSLNRQSALQRAHPEDSPSQILARMRAEHNAFLKKNNPLRSLINEGILYDPEMDLVDLREHYKENQITAFAKRNRDSITTHLILLNIKRACPEDVNTLLTIKKHIIQYINYTEANPPEKPLQTYTNRLKAAEEMLVMLQKGGTIKNDIIPAIKTQASIIANNKPGLRELGFLGWLHSLTDNHKPQACIETSATLKAIDLIVVSQETELSPKKHEKLISHKAADGELTNTHTIQYR
ncbi:hypothetical protein Lpar_1943 [Legionella parisiensis]|uniref:Lpg0393-like VPS9-like domain-containing protein n=2 Tax=Legionella parisiensis TaxID=45071 RepID=A0A1E5JLC6_9GAMM|nr:hypothetical protein Lpar_1943 [Legionella parisiensis]OEH45351.1 hypothetical protein lpari_03685 [Legionella parisiensis]STX76981.1 Uncharacterised protein [Legionella parisiensis]